LKNFGKGTRHVLLPHWKPFFLFKSNDDSEEFRRRFRSDDELR